MPKVTLANGKIFDALPDTSLLDSAKSHGVALEYSCRTGRCGVCKAKASTVNTLVRQPEQALTLEEVDEGYILTCCRVALDDLSLDVDDLGEIGSLETKTLPCRIDSIERLNADVVGVVLRTPPGTLLKYLPGQYIDVIAKSGVRRSYSIANLNRPDGKLELQIRFVPGGVLSAYWFEEAKPNDLLRLEGPLGTFRLRKQPVKYLIFMATGTGVAPVKAMLEQLEDDSSLHPNAQIYVYWGGRHADDIYWMPTFNNREIKFVPVLSRPSQVWGGRQGYIQQILLEDGLDLSHACVYACGSEDMIKSAKAVLIAAGLDAKKFYSDAFVSSN